MADNSRIEELRRRVQKDPASIAFAQLAEEYRRAGHYEDAVDVCRAGLDRHPSYLSARVTLGRALIERERFDEAASELELVLQSAPENLAAIRGLAEIHQRRGDLGEALKQYQNALGIAKHDPDLEESVSELSRQLGTPMVSPGAAEAGRERIEPPPIPFDVSLNEAIDFDAQVAPPPAASELPERRMIPPSPELAAAADEFTKALEALSALSIDLPDTPLATGSLDLPEPKPAESHAAMAEPPIDPEHEVDLDRFLECESVDAAASLGQDLDAPAAQLHASADTEPLAVAPEPSPTPQQSVLNRLQSWLGAIVSDREARASRS